jgi:hypothetical protein
MKYSLPAAAVLAAITASACGAEFGDLIAAPVTLDGRIGPVHVGMTAEEFHQATARRFEERNREEDPNCYYAVPPMRQEDEVKVRFMIVDGVVAAIQVGHPSVRTDRGIEVGNSAARVRDAYGAGVRRIRGTEPAADVEFLVVRTPDGAIETSFALEDERVSGYAVGFPSAVEAHDGCM